MTDVEIKTGMTDAECERLDKYYTENTFTPGPNLLKQGIKPGQVRNTLLLKDVDRDVIEYLRSQTAAAHKTQTEVINDLVHEKLIVSV
ncbi:hypothetical protein FACS1894141_3470 [Spirochaetia bacterium]|nr:hypothetical protein FACS1894141_3470 [Spirochaetia bacterium]